MTNDDVRRSKIWRADGDDGAEIGQEPVASFIASEVMRDPDIRVALEGPWGSGKTRILNLIQKKLKAPDNKDIVVAWYDPWKYSPDETVLRRTLLDAIGRAVDEQCPECQGKVTRDRFHGEVESINTRPAVEWKGSMAAFKNFLGILWDRVTFYLLFAVFWIALFIGGTLLQNEFPALGTSLTVIIASIGIILLTALIKDAVQTIQLVQISPYVRTSLPKLDQIDQFEAEYRSVMMCLAEQKNNLVVLVDDLDRCGEHEIRTVMSGLTTYMEVPHEMNGGRVAFVVAMDENKIVHALRGQKNDSDVRQNVIQKHFHIVVPVPYPTDTVLLKVLDSTLEELNWNVPLKARRRMTHLIAVHANSNLRILRSTTTEAYTIARYYTEVLEPQGIKVAQELVEDPILRFRVALIREITPSDSLRSFLSNPRIWLGRDSWTPGLKRELFEMAPEFARDQLDPRPLLGFAQGMMLAAVIPAIDQTTSALRANDQAQLNGLIDGLQPEALISLVSLINATKLPKQPPDQVGHLVSGLVGILHRVREYLDWRDINTFKFLAEHLHNSLQPSQLPSTNYLQWIEVAASIGDRALDGLFQSDFLLLKPPHQPHMLEQLLQSVLKGDVEARLAYQLYARIIGNNNWDALWPVAVRLVQAGKLGTCKELHQLQVDCMENWNYGQKPDGPPKELYTMELVQGMEEELHERAAKAYQIAANQPHENTRKFVKSLPKEWPAWINHEPNGSSE